MTPMFSAIAVYGGMLALIYAAYGSDAFWWTVLGALLILFVVTLVDTIRKWGR